MNLNNFENLIDQKIIDRGFSYYEYEHIQDIEQLEKNEFSALVLGSEKYSVFIRLNNNIEIIDHSCDCPYDWGNYCKHKVAVLYYLKDSKLYEQPIQEGKIGKIKSDLGKLKKKEIIKTIIELAKRNRNLRNVLMLELSHEIE